ncbi:MAG: hydroxymethylglutaryl-CoA reductase [Flavobacteriales bacterium]
MNEYPYVPGRGVVKESTTQERVDFLEQAGFEVDHISKSEIPTDSLANNIESHIGSVEIPVGLAGPLLFKSGSEIPDYRYAPIATLEGALLASVNRGAKVISKCGGITSKVLHQRMVRCPLFLFDSLAESITFSEWLENHFELIKEQADAHSNYGKLVKIEPQVSGKNVHARFFFETGDAAGQNMTTSSTHKTIMWIYDYYTKVAGLPMKKVFIEGNGSSDKKVSQYNISNGRGSHVIAECELLEEEIKKLLHTTSDELVARFNTSATISRLNGMVGHNMNVANVIAGVFAATGQDLACIHESSTGILTVEKTDKGLYLCLHLPNLVVGTVGGGTHLKAQQEALGLMGCKGKGTAKRFAEMIAGFAMALEISTSAAIVAGHFTAAHEKLGRNRPVS